jgi:ADP-ribose pyrophosphatase YjhB (NUDIX family)
VRRIRIWQFRLSRLLGRLLTWLAAILTLGRIPPFVSTSAVVVQRGRILVVMDPIRREPVLPGGHLKWRETPLHALAREVREETGYLIEPGALLGAFAGEEWTGEAGVVRLVYEAAVTGGALASSAEGDACWYPVEELLRSDSRDAKIVRLWSERTHRAD